MNKEIKPVNYTYREHFQIRGYLSPKMIEELLDKLDATEQELVECISSLDDADDEAEYWRKKV